MPLTLVFLWPPGVHGHGWLLLALAVVLAAWGRPANPPLVFAGLGFFWYLAVNPGPWVTVSIYLLTAFALFPVFRDLSHKRRILWASLWVALGLVQGIVQLDALPAIAADLNLPESIRSFAAAGRPMGPFHLPSHLGFAAGCGLILAASLWQSLSGIRRLIPAGFAGLSLAGLWLTSSFSAMVWLAPALVLSWLLFTDRKGESLWPRRLSPMRVSLILGALGALAAGIIWRRQSHGISLLGSLGDHLADLSALPYLMDYWTPLGVGPGGLQTGLLNHALAVTEFHETRYLHNSWLQLAFELGWIPLGFLLLLLVSRFKRQGMGKTDLWSGAVLAYFLLFNLTDFLAYQILPLLLVLPAVGSLIFREKDTHEASAPASSPLPTLLATLCTCLACAWFGSQGLWQEAVFSARLDKRVAPAPPALLEKGARAGLPLNNETAIFLLPRAIAELQKPDPDTTLFERLRTHPDPGVRKSLSRHLQSQGFPDQGIRMEQPWRP